MKGLRGLFLIIFLISFIGQSDAFVQNRFQWWKIHRKELIKEKKHVESTEQILPPTLNIIRNEIKRSDRIIFVYDSKIRNNGSLSLVRKNYTDKMLSPIIKKSALFVYSVSGLDFFIKNSCSEESIKKTKLLIKEAVNESCRNITGQDPNEITAIMMKEMIRPIDWKNISMEIVLNSLDVKKSIILQKISVSLKNNIKSLISGNATLNTREMKELVSKACAMVNADKIITSEIRYENSVIDNSWCWRRIRQGFNRIFKSYADAVSMSSGTGRMPLKKARYYTFYPHELEPVIFEKEYEHRLGVFLKKGKSVSSDVNGLRCYLQDPDSFKKTMSSINRFRTGKGSAVKGTEGSKHFTSLRRKFSGLISVYERPLKDVFSSEENSIKILKEKHFEFEGIQPGLDSRVEAFRLAQEELSDINYLLHSYSELSLKYLKWLSGIRKKNGDDVSKSYDYQIKRSEYYALFLKMLARDASDSGSIGNAGLHAKMISSGRRIGKAVHFMICSLSPPSKDTLEMNRNQIRNLREEKNNSAKRIKLSVQEINFYFRKYNRDRIASQRKRKKMEAGLMGKIAQYEVDALLKDAMEYTELYRQMNYSGEAFAHYCIFYKNLKKMIHSGADPGPVIGCIKRASLIPFVYEFDSTRLNRESVTKKYLKKRGRTAIARLISVLRYYRQKAVEINDPPDREDIEKIRAVLQKRSFVKIGSWRMNESNFMLVDKKAVSELKILYNRYAWKKTKHLSVKPEHSKFSFNIGDSTVIFNKPWGWEELPYSSPDDGNRIIKKLGTPGRDSEICFLSFPAAAGLRQASESWINRNGGIMIGKRWGSKEGKKYLWMLSKNKPGSIFETYAVSGKGYVLFLSGKTGKKKYNFFKSKFDSIFESLIIRKNSKTVKVAQSENSGKEHQLPVNVR